MLRYKLACSALHLGNYLTPEALDNCCFKARPSIDADQGAVLTANHSFKSLFLPGDLHDQERFTLDPCRGDCLRFLRRLQHRWLASYLAVRDYHFASRGCNRSPGDARKRGRSGPANDKACYTPPLLIAHKHALACGKGGYRRPVPFPVFCRLLGRTCVACLAYHTICCGRTKAIAIRAKRTWLL